MFNDDAEMLIKNHGATNALSRALACLSGYTQSVNQRSLVSSLEGFVSYLIQSDK